MTDHYNADSLFELERLGSKSFNMMSKMYQLLINIDRMSELSTPQNLTKLSAKLEEIKYYLTN